MIFTQEDIDEFLKNHQGIDHQDKINITDYIWKKWVKFEKSELQLPDFIAAWHRARGNTEEFRVIEDRALWFYESVVEGNNKKKRSNDFDPSEVYTKSYSD